MVSGSRRRSQPPDLGPPEPDLVWAIAAASRPEQGRRTSRAAGLDPDGASLAPTDAVADVVEY
jgi:hypothetical protein